MMNLTRKGGFISVFMAAMFLLFACDRNSVDGDLKAYIDTLKSSNTEGGVKADVARVSQAVAPIPVAFEPSKRRSPFETPDTAPATAKAKAATNPLHAYAVDMLVFIGTVTQDAHTVAFISAPDNRVYQIKVGDLIGNNDSKVLAIEADHVSLEDMYTEDGGSKPEKRIVTIKLKEASQ
jgi:Tfp pilus assembly protein PilP